MRLLQVRVLRVNTFEQTSCYGNTRIPHGDLDLQYKVERQSGTTMRGGGALAGGGSPACGGGQGWPGGGGQGWPRQRRQNVASYNGAGGAGAFPQLKGKFGMRDHSYSLASGCDGCASTFKRGGGGLAIGGGCRGGRSPRRQGRAAPILNTSGSARWFDVAGQGLKSRSCKRRPRNRNCKPRPCECKRPRPCKRLTRAKTAMVMLM